MHKEQAQLFRLLAEKQALDINTISLNSRLHEDLNIKPLSTDSVELLFDIEKEFDIQIDNEEFLDVTTVKQLLNVIKRKISQRDSEENSDDY